MSGDGSSKFAMFDLSSNPVVGGVGSSLGLGQGTKNVPMIAKQQPDNADKNQPKSLSGAPKMSSSMEMARRKLRAFVVQKKTVPTVSPLTSMSAKLETIPAVTKPLKQKLDLPEHSRKMIRSIADIEDEKRKQERLRIIFNLNIPLWCLPDEVKPNMNTAQPTSSMPPLNKHILTMEQLNKLISDAKKFEKQGITIKYSHTKCNNRTMPIEFIPIIQRSDEQSLINVDMDLGENEIKEKFPSNNTLGGNKESSIPLTFAKNKRAREEIEEETLYGVGASDDDQISMTKRGRTTCESELKAERRDLDGHRSHRESPRDRRRLRERRSPRRKSGSKDRIRSPRRRSGSKDRRSPQRRSGSKKRRSPQKRSGSKDRQKSPQIRSGSKERRSLQRRSGSRNRRSPRKRLSSKDKKRSPQNLSMPRRSGSRDRIRSPSKRSPSKDRRKSQHTTNMKVFFMVPEHKKYLLSANGALTKHLKAMTGICYVEEINISGDNTYYIQGNKESVHKAKQFISKFLEDYEDDKTLQDTIENSRAKSGSTQMKRGSRDKSISPQSRAGSAKKSVEVKVSISLPDNKRCLLGVDGELTKILTAMSGIHYSEEINDRGDKNFFMQGDVKSIRKAKRVIRILVGTKVRSKDKNKSQKDKAVSKDRSRSPKKEFGYKNRSRSCSSDDRSRSHRSSSGHRKRSRSPQNEEVTNERIRSYSRDRSRSRSRSHRSSSGHRKRSRSPQNEEVTNERIRSYSRDRSRSRSRSHRSSSGHRKRSRSPQNEEVTNERIRSYSRDRSRSGRITADSKDRSRFDRSTSYSSDRNSLHRRSSFFRNRSRSLQSTVSSRDRSTSPRSPTQEPKFSIQGEAVSSLPYEITPQIPDFTQQWIDYYRSYGMFEDAQALEDRLVYQSHDCFNSKVKGFGVLSEISDHISIPNKLVDAVIGDCLEKITFLQTQYGCVITMAPESKGKLNMICTLTGTQEAVSGAKEALNRILQDEFFKNIVDTTKLKKESNILPSHRKEYMQDSSINQKNLVQNISDFNIEPIRRISTQDNFEQNVSSHYGKEYLQEASSNQKDLVRKVSDHNIESVRKFPTHDDYEQDVSVIYGKEYLQEASKNQKDLVRKVSSDDDLESETSANNMKETKRDVFSSYKNKCTHEDLSKQNDLMYKASPNKKIEFVQKVSKNNKNDSQRDIAPKNKIVKEVLKNQKKESEQVVFFNTEIIQEFPKSNKKESPQSRNEATVSERRLPSHALFTSERHSVKKATVAKANNLNDRMVRGIAMYEFDNFDLDSD